jgi:hypothetical protein
MIIRSSGRYKIGIVLLAASLFYLWSWIWREDLERPFPATGGPAKDFFVLSRSTIVSLSWWTRGGDPGPSYTSDKLDIAITDNVVSATYIRARFDAAYAPPFRSEEFAGNLPSTEWQSLFAAIDGDQMFDKHIPAEDRSDLADALKDTVEVVAKTGKRTKTFYELSDDEFVASRAARNNIANFLVKHGRHRLRTPAK